MSTVCITHTDSFCFAVADLLCATCRCGREVPHAVVAELMRRTGQEHEVAAQFDLLHHARRHIGRAMLARASRCANTSFVAALARGCLATRDVHAAGVCRAWVGVELVPVTSV